ncbi:MAG: NAD-dependent epimerase/dehydratase family protein, partial [Pseudoclavibacter sp.]
TSDSDDTPDTVLVTGITGFIGGYVAAELLNRGYAVRGSLRSRGRANEVRAALEHAGVSAETIASRVSFVELDLLRDEGWDDAVSGCRFVAHVASPFITGRPKHPDDLIRPAVEGTRRAVTAALRSGVERIVVTSSVAAVQQGRGAESRTLSAGDWTDPDGPNVTAYAKSKVFAEREAWAIAGAEGSTDRVAVINPGTVLGPLLSDDPGTSVGVLLRLIDGELPALPDLRLPWVDVRDIAEAHAAAFTDPAAAGARTIVTSDSISLIDIAAMIRERTPELAGRVPTRALPNGLAKTVGMFVPDLRANRTFIGAQRSFDHAPAEALLGHARRPIPEAVEATVRSLAVRGLVDAG